jgi:hypothetical protein
MTIGVVSFVIGVIAGVYVSDYVARGVDEDVKRHRWLISCQNLVLRGALQKMSLSEDDRRLRDLILEDLKGFTTEVLSKSSHEAVKEPASNSF